MTAGKWWAYSGVAIAPVLIIVCAREDQSQEFQTPSSHGVPRPVKCTAPDNLEPA